MNVLRLRLSLCAALAVFAGCRGSQPPIGASGTVAQPATALARAHPATSGDSIPYHKTFHFTGKTQSFVIPTGVSQVRVIVRGGAGAGPDVGGRGGRVSAIIPVNEGGTLYIRVGGAASGSRGGFNDGGKGGRGNYCSNCDGGGGGGASDIRLIANDLSSRIIVAAGGGGEGGHFVRGHKPGAGGGGGGLTGQAGRDAKACGGRGGGGGTQTQGGAGGKGGHCYIGDGNPGADGLFGLGGKGGHGYYGSVAGGAGGGGGGGVITAVAAAGPDLRTTALANMEAAAEAAAGLHTRNQVPCT